MKNRSDCFLAPGQTSATSTLEVGSSQPTMISCRYFSRSIPLTDIRAIFHELSFSRCIISLPDCGLLCGVREGGEAGKVAGRDGYGALKQGECS